MKPAPFDYLRPRTAQEAVAALAGAALAGADGEAKVLAGGQSLVPVLAMRLAHPTALVDINAVEGLDELSFCDGMLRVGATVRQRRLQHDPGVTQVPLLARALPWIGHRELRGRGTVCGSLAHADPAAELPAVAVLLDATLQVTGPDGRRTIGARDFFTAPMTTALAPDELLLSASFPVAQPGDGYGFAELARRHGDFALTGVAVRVRRDPLQARLSAFGVSATPIVQDVTLLLQSALETSPSPDEHALTSALTPLLSLLADEVVDTPGDLHASTAYRRRLFTVLASRELARAFTQASAPGDRARAPADVRRPPAGARARSAPLPSRLEPAPAHASVTTTFSVNGKQVEVTGPPRLTLADALRDRLRLTGTHVGCEHGICGMCTVLVDNQAARSCLLFACQLDGAEILTVEGLGRPGELHPLQQAFGRHHALQCGFCTPGFLLSAYDLLVHRPDVTEPELPAELSGVLCRCTGYRNILTAVAETAREHRDGLPAPLNCLPREAVEAGPLGRK